MLVLASASPRRRELLSLMTADFEVRPSAIDEPLPPGPLAEAVGRLALRKVRAVADLRPARPLARGEPIVILGADTIVRVEGEAFGKPASPADARRMLLRLRGRSHDVLSGVAVLDARTRRAATETAVSKVWMRHFTPEELDAYLETGEPFDKAGAYAVQGAGGDFVVAIRGSYSNVIGLPLGVTRRLLAAFGVELIAPVGPPPPAGAGPRGGAPRVEGS